MGITAGGVQTVGLKAVFDTKEFKQGLNTFLKGINDAVKASQQGAKSISGFGKATGNISSGTQQASQSLLGLVKSEGLLTTLTSKATTGLTAMGGSAAKLAPLIGGAAAAAGTAATIIGGVLVVGLAAAVAGVAALVGGLVSLAVSFAAIVKKGMPLASRIDELRLSAQLLGQQMGLTQKQLDGLADSMRESGIRGDVAYNAIAQLSRMQLSPELAPGLADVAKNLAVLAQDGADTSETLDRIIYGIQTLNPRVLRTAGVITTLTQAYEVYAKENDIAVESMTSYERQLALVNEVMRQGAVVAGVYDLAMQNPGKALRSLTGRELPELYAAISQYFLPGFAKIVTAVREFVNTLRHAVGEGGAFEPILIRMGAVASMVGDIFLKISGWFKSLFVPAMKGTIDNTQKGMDAMVNVAGDKGTEFVNTLVDKLSSAAASAFEWGVNIVTQLADGIIKGVSSALTFAMQQIGKLLGFFLAPGSPPRVAPNIDEWGLEAAKQWLHGFTEADFGILGAIEGPLKEALDILGTGDMLPALTKDMFKGLSEGGKLDPSFFEQIAKAAGPFGDEIARLAMLQEDLAFAEQDVVKAEEALEAARKRNLAAQQKVVDTTAEYVALQRAGASKDVLAQKLKELNAAEKERDVSAQQIDDSEQKLTAAQEYAKAMQDQVKMQKEIVDQLLKLAQLQLPETEKEETEKAGKGIGESLAEGLAEGFGGAFTGISDILKEKIDKMKQMLLEKFAELIQPIKDKWEQEWQPIWYNLTKEWKIFTDILKQFWDEKLKPVWDELHKFLTKTLTKAIDEFATWWDGSLMGTLRNASTWLSTEFFKRLVDFKLLLRDLAELGVVYLEGKWKDFKGTLEILKAYIETEFVRVIDKIKKWFSNEQEELGGIIATFIADKLDKLVEGFGLVGDKVNDLKQWIADLAEAIRNFDLGALIALLHASPPPLARGISEVINQIDQMTNKAIPQLNRAMANANLGEFGNLTGSSPVINNVSSTKQINIDMGGQTLSNGMDLAQLQSGVVSALKAGTGMGF